MKSREEKLHEQSLKQWYLETLNNLEILINELKYIEKINELNKIRAKNLTQSIELESERLEQAKIDYQFLND